MNEAMNTRNAQLLGMLGITAATCGVFLYAEGIGPALVAAALLLAFTALVHFGRRRSDTIEVMSGVGDERIRGLYTRSVAFVGSVMAFVLPGWWLVTVAWSSSPGGASWAPGGSSPETRSSPTSAPAPHGRSRRRSAAP
jgi:cell division protein FtsX